MRILLITHYYPAHGGGIEIATERLVRELTAKGHKFTWVASDCDPAPMMAGLHSVPARCWNGIEQAKGIPVPIWSPLDLWGLGALIREHDIVWLHDTLYFGQIAGAICAYRFNRPLIVTQHVGEIPYQQSWLRGLQKLAYLCVGNPILRLADRTAFVSDRVAAQFAPALKYKPAVIPLGVDHTTFAPLSFEEREALRQKHDIAPGRFAVLFVGRFVERKGVHIVQRLSRLLPDITFNVCGAGPMTVRQGANLALRGKRTPEQLRELYQASDLLVLPSIGEGFPLVIQEALACGLPVLCSEETADGNLSAKPHLYTAPVDPLLSDQTTKRWSEKLKELAAQPQILREKGQKAAEFAKQHWGWDKTAAAYDRLFREMA